MNSPHLETALSFIRRTREGLLDNKPVVAYTMLEKAEEYVRHAQNDAVPIVENKEPPGMEDPKPGTHLYHVKRLWMSSEGFDKAFLGNLYDHLNALYVEQRIYKAEDK